MREPDLARILEIERSSFGQDAYDRNLFAEYLQRCGEISLVCERAGKLEGYLIGCVQGSRAELISIAVDPEARGSGAGSALLVSFIRRVRARGALRIRLMVKEVNNEAISLYRKYGFRKLRIASGYYEDGSDGILMTRKFKSLETRA